MKITFLVSGTIRSNFSYRALSLAKALYSRGFEVSIIAPRADKYNNFVTEKISFIDGVRIIQPFQFETKLAEVNLLPYLVGAAYAILREKPDLVYIYKPTPISIVGLIAKIFRGTSVVLDMDDLGSEVMKIEGHPMHQRAIVAWCEWLSAKWADRIVVASTFLQNRYRTQFPGKPIYFIPNGADQNWFSPLLPQTSNHRIVFMGAMNRRSILEPLFDALPKVMEQYPGLEILIMGGGKYLEYFRKKSQAFKTSRRIIFMGWLGIDDLRSRLHAGDIGYCYMSDEMTTRAASNMKVSQYMARGVVPLVSDVGDLGVMVSWGEAGYVCKADDPKALLNGLLAALADRERMKKSERARMIAQNVFNWDILAAKFIDWSKLYQEAK